MPKRYNTPHRSRVVKTRLSEEEYADFTARLAPYGISQSEFLRQAIRRTAIPVSYTHLKKGQRGRTPCFWSGSVGLPFKRQSLPSSGTDAVSYTHLDVYKRQVIPPHGPAGGPPGGRRHLGNQRFGQHFAGIVEIIALGSAGLVGIVVQQHRIVVHGNEKIGPKLGD